MSLRSRFERALPDREARCAAIIHGAAAAAAGAGALTVVPGADAVAIAPVQVAMVTALANEFDVPVTEAALRSTIYASLGTIVGKGGAGLLLRWVPIAGNVVRASVAASVTEALGWTVVKRLKEGGALI